MHINKIKQLLSARNRAAIAAGVLCALLFAGTAWAQVMTGNAYRIQSDSVNVGGGLGTSTNYSIEDTLGEVATGESAGTAYRLKAGYQQMGEVYVAITPVSDVTLSPDLGGLTGGTANGQTLVTVTTDSPAGYELSLKSSTSPALRATADSFADYVPAGSDPDYSFTVVNTASEFGFSPEGQDIVQKFKDNGSACNTGSGDTVNACWTGLQTTGEVVSRGVSSNHPNGSLTTLKFRAESGMSHFQQDGVYTANLSVTAIAL